MIPPDAPPRAHDLKTRQPYFSAVAAGVKNFEVRYDDRGYQRGDTLNLREWSSRNGGEYTGRHVTRTVTYVLRHAEGYGLATGFVVLGLAHPNAQARPRRCCDTHIDGPPRSNGMAYCCDPNDCGPCCPHCPTCPTQNRDRVDLIAATIHQHACGCDSTDDPDIDSCAVHPAMADAAAVAVLGLGHLERTAS